MPSAPCSPGLKAPSVHQEGQHSSLPLGLPLKARRVTPGKRRNRPHRRTSSSAGPGTAPVCSGLSHCSEVPPRSPTPVPVPSTGDSRNTGTAPPEAGGGRRLPTKQRRSLQFQLKNSTRAFDLAENKAPAASLMEFLSELEAQARDRPQSFAHAWAHAWSRPCSLCQRSPQARRLSPGSATTAH